MVGPRDEDDLPVTEEVGSEGGSYADPTVQVATRTGQLPRVDRSEPDRSAPGAVAGAVAPTPEGPEDGVRAHDAPDPAKEADTSEYSATKAPENRDHVESAPGGDPAQTPGGQHGADAQSGMSGLDRATVPSHGDDLGLTDQGGNRRGERQGRESR
jgi:hypothetical protein